MKSRKLTLQNFIFIVLFLFPTVSLTQTVDSLLENPVKCLTDTNCLKTKILSLEDLGSLSLKAVVSLYNKEDSTKTPISILLLFKYSKSAQDYNFFVVIDLPGGITYGGKDGLIDNVAFMLNDQRHCLFYFPNKIGIKVIGGRFDKERFDRLITEKNKKEFLLY